VITYRDINLINNGLKIFEKILVVRIDNYWINKEFIKPELLRFRNREKCICLYISLRIIRKRSKLENKDIAFLCFFFYDFKKGYNSVPMY